MFGFGKKKPEGKALAFKDGTAFFDYQCKFGHTNIEENVAVIALVVDAKELFGVPTAISINKDGSQLAALRVVSDDGGFLVFANTPSSKGDKLQVGDVVLWVPATYKKEMGERMEDPRSGWIGLIRAKVQPEINLTTDSFCILSKYN